MFARLVLVVFVFCSVLEAHPVIYKGGVAVMGVTRPRMGRFEANYSLLNNFSVGMTYRRYLLTDRELQAAFPQLNLLLKRWNLSSSQANIYLKGGAGYVDDSLNKAGVGFYSGIQADWEDRKYYTAVRADALFNSKRTPYTLQGRLGVAPYKSKFDELQVWLIGQVDYMPQVNRNVLVTPMFRFFYRSALWEVGTSLTGNWFLQLMAHF